MEHNTHNTAARAEAFRVTFETMAAEVLTTSRKAAQERALSAILQAPAPVAAVGTFSRKFALALRQLGSLSVNSREFAKAAAEFFALQAAACAASVELAEVLA